MQCLYAPYILVHGYLPRNVKAIAWYSVVARLPETKSVAIQRYIDTAKHPALTAWHPTRTIPTPVLWNKKKNGNYKSEAV